MALESWVSSLSSLSVYAFVLVFALAWWRTSWKAPPGPFKLPWFGNIFHVPPRESWRWFEWLARNYGSIAYVRLMGDSLIVLSDPKDAENLLGVRSYNYSSRKYLPYAGKYRSGNKRLLLLPYNDEFKHQRAAMRLLFTEDQSKINRNRQSLQSKKLLFELLDNSDYVQALKHYSSGIILGICYGMSLDEAEAQFSNVLRNNDSVGSDLQPGARLVDIFHWLDYFPDWMSPWRAEARQKHAEEFELFDSWVNIARAKAVEGGESFIQRLLASREKVGVDNKTISYIGGSFIEAGTNTTSCLLHCFLLACLSNPAVIQRAREEFDRVLLGNPPTWDDFKSLPYLFAVLKETLRWCPVTPLAFPHLAESQDYYKGYQIPAGSLVVVSIWNMHRDPKSFENPSKYDPDRFFSSNQDGRLPEGASIADGLWAFGFGKRACPGKQLALDSIWLAIGSILWAFDLQLAENASLPEDVDSLLTWRDNVNIEPNDLNIRFKPRSAEIEARIRAQWEELN